MEIPHAGRELDALVAERIMGWTRLHVDGELFGIPPGHMQEALVPSYSMDMAAAWGVVERLRDLHQAWCAKWSGHFPEAIKRFAEMSEERRISYGNDPEELANEMTGAKPFEFEAFFNRAHRAVDRCWPYSFLYLTPEIVCRSAVGAFPCPAETVQA